MYLLPNDVCRTNTLLYPTYHLLMSNWAHKQQISSLISRSFHNIFLFGIQHHDHTVKQWILWWSHPGNYCQFCWLNIKWDLSVGNVSFVREIAPLPRQLRNKAFRTGGAIARVTALVPCQVSATHLRMGHPLNLIQTFSFNERLICHEYVVIKGKWINLAWLWVVL